MKNVAILISGGGTTAEATIRAWQKKILTNINPLVISSNAHAKGNERVRKLGLEPIVIDVTTFPTREAFDNKLYDLLEERRIDIISLQGWLLLVPKKIVEKYRGRIFNQHPGPLDPGRPDFGGRGMSTPYRTNCARIAYLWTTGEDYWLESDTHFVSEKFDEGAIIRTQKMMIPRRKHKTTIQKLREHPKRLVETTHSVQKKFYPIEHHNVIKTLQIMIRGTVPEYTRKSPLIPKEHILALQEAKQLAIELFPKYNL